MVTVQDTSGGSASVGLQIPGVPVLTKERPWLQQASDGLSRISRKRRHRLPHQSLCSTLTVSDRLETYVYESPDGGETVYRRRPGSNEKEIIQRPETSRWDLLQRQKLWGEIHRAAERDPTLREMLDQVEVYHILKKNSP